MYICVLLVYVELYMYISCSQNLFDFLNKNQFPLKMLNDTPKIFIKISLKYQLNYSRYLHIFKMKQ